MLTILFVWMVQFVVLGAIGYMVSVFLQWAFKTDFSFHLIHYLVLGLCTLTLILAFISLVGSVSVIAFVLIASPAIVVYILKLKHFTLLLKNYIAPFRNQGILLKLTSLSLLAFCLIYAVGEARVFDTGLYHAQAIRWINEYAVVPGLGNLHSRFAFNSHYFIAQAFFNLTYFQGGNSVLFGLNSFFYLVVVSSILRMFMLSESKREAIFYALIIVVASVVVLPRIQSPSPDSISFLLIIHVMLLFYDAKFTYQKQHDFFYTYAFIVICFLVTVKLSNLPLLLFSLVAYRAFNVRLLLKYTVIFLLFLIPFFIRNYYLSGYLIYPFPGIDWFDSDWKIAAQKCYEEIDSIKAWAIAPGEAPETIVNLPFYAKTSLWFMRLDVFSKIIIAVNLMLPVLLLKKIQWKESTQLIFWIAIVTNLLYWFINAPDPRFSFGILVFCFAFVISQFPFIPESQFIKHLLKPVMAFILIGSLAAYAVYKTAYTTHVFTHNLLLPEPLKSVQLVHENGIHFTTEADGRCYNAPLPCACSKNPEIIFRTENIADGFKIKK